MGSLPGDARGEGPGDEEVLLGERGEGGGCADEGVGGGAGGTYDMISFSKRLKRYLEGVVRGLPLSTSAPRGGGGPKIGRFYGQTVLWLCGQGGGRRGSKIPKILRTYLIEAPYYKKTYSKTDFPLTTETLPEKACS